MTDLWFDRELSDISRGGGVLYASRPGQLWAIHLTQLVHSDTQQESTELLGLYGSAAEGIGYSLLKHGQSLPPSLEEWATARSVPAADLGGWQPTLVTIDGQAHLALTRTFETVNVFATTWNDQHVTALTPATETVAHLIHTDLPDVQPPDWEQSGGAAPEGPGARSG
jgi:hypothetical protein